MFIVLTQDNSAELIRVNANSICSYHNINKYKKNKNTDTFSFQSVTEVLLNTGTKFDVVESSGEIDVLLRTITQVIRGYQTIKED
jgi:hypothetical protein